MPDNQTGLLNEMLEKVLGGELSFRIDETLLDGEHGQLYHNLCSLLDMHTNYIFEMQAAAGKITSVTADLTTTLEESDGLSHELFDNAVRLGGLNDRNFENTVGAVGSMKELIAHLDDIHDSAVGAREANARAEDAIKSGMTQVFSLIELIGSIDTTTRQTIDYLEKLKTSAGRIAQILKNVNNIARQTEILSYNASIESKRAGAQGRGFGVIAGAIRDLASESKREVSNIEDVIDVVSSGLEELAGNIYNDYSNVSKSVERTHIIEESLGRINDTYSGLSGLINMITDTFEAEHALADNVSGEMNSVEENSRGVNEGFDAINASIGRQKAVIEALTELGAFLQEASRSLSELTGRSGGVSYDRGRVSQLSQRVFSLLRDEVLGQDSFLQMTPEGHKPLLDRILDNDYIEAIWSNDRRGRFIYSIPPAGILNASARDWFRESAGGRPFVSDVYISSITKRPCVTVSMPVKDEAGRVLCVIGADLKIS